MNPFNTAKSLSHEKEYWIKIGNVDNRLVIFLNSETIWDSGIIHNDPKLHKAVEITHLLNPLENYSNELIFEGLGAVDSVCSRLFNLSNT
ncbi:MAG: hypothetical protein MZV63_72380, partial [Marinilabiliales bacterium]|nr:hypothetical protein [Marinilabiliales bacterium]